VELPFLRRTSATKTKTSEELDSEFAEIFRVLHDSHCNDAVPAESEDADPSGPPWGPYAERIVDQHVKCEELDLLDKAEVIQVTRESHGYKVCTNTSSSSSATTKLAQDDAEKHTDAPTESRSSSKDHQGSVMEAMDSTMHRIQKKLDKVKTMRWQFLNGDMQHDMTLLALG